MDAKYGILLKDAKDVLAKNKIETGWEGNSANSYDIKIVNNKDLYEVSLKSGERLLKRFWPDLKTHRYTGASILTRELPEYKNNPLMFAPDTPISETAESLNAKIQVPLYGGARYEQNISLFGSRDTNIEDLARALNDMTGFSRIIAECYADSLENEKTKQKRIWQESTDGFVNRLGTRF